MKKKQVLLALTAAAGLSFTACTTAPAAKAATPQTMNVTMPSSDSYVIKAGKLNVRTEPNQKSAILGTVSSEQKVTVKGFANANWAQIEFKGKKAYISTHFLMKTASQAKTAKQTAFYSPTPENGKAKQLSSGTEVTLLGWGFSDNGGFDFSWAFVDYGGVKGYIQTKDLQIR
ncbi:SH3 domain-containing protein [Bacillus mojavensis]|uniref:SH3 domain-containing protein n=1 Tax=Bacillus mojavensis TaxID=72360 RepID=UPI002DBFFDA7|nr:SH3 domain-containing protein [Bacillus mojavensis]MEC1615507.1 SH3 domain-containing protein [Bacillus mojavensis]MEC1621683.1 SH3 domain-containing protein [Bacillus mojavensis]MEC1661584.1 SH3 domain-containing protein [Bacillus mojavensis]MEC1685602.1 SH3 domain-containing protein [Bacillus mojavensis]MEC1691266.1 SH3 domain-containing protein [Bacillus mojavensis]